MARLTVEQVTVFADRKGVKRNAVVNFLLTLDGMTFSECYANLDQDSRSYKWNLATCKAINDGIKLAFK